MMLLPTHPRAIGVEKRDGCDDGGAAIADDLDLEPVPRGSKLRGYIAERQGFLHVVGVAAGGDPAHDLAGMPDRLIADAIGAVVRHHEGDEAALRAGFLLSHSGVATDEVVLAQMDEAAEPGLERPIDRAVFPGPATEAFFQA